MADALTLGASVREAVGVEGSLENHAAYELNAVVCLESEFEASHQIWG